MPRHLLSETSFDKIDDLLISIRQKFDQLSNYAQDSKWQSDQHLADLSIHFYHIIVAIHGLWEREREEEKPIKRK